MARTPTEAQKARMVRQEMLASELSIMATRLKEACEDGWLFDDNGIINCSSIVEDYVRMTINIDPVIVGPVCERSK